MSTILNDVKAIIGSIAPEDTSFDTEILLHINGKLADVVQLGAGTPGFEADEQSTWREFLGENYAYLTRVKSYVGLSVKLIFDPPPNSFLVKALEDEIKEAEFRINVTAETGP